MARNAPDEAHVHEEMFNKALGEALRSAMPLLVKVECSRVLSGREHSKKRPDILIIDDRLPPCIVECSYDPKNANDDAKAKLGHVVKRKRRMVKTCISLHIPPEFETKEAMKDDVLACANLGFAVYQGTNDDPRRWPEKGFIEGGVRDLSTLISAVSLPKEDIEDVADGVAALIDDAAAILDVLSYEAKRNIDDHINRGSVLKSLKTTMVLWLNALLTQQRLHKQNVPNIPPLDFSGAKLPNHAKQIKVWRQIQEVNWRAIFDPAIEVLKIAGDSDPNAVGEVLEHLVNAVNEIEIAGLGLHINVGAELFPKLSDDRKQAAAFYTQAPTAELLASLTIRRDDLSSEEWADSALFTKRCIADLACGTGTLLRAGYRRVQALHEASSARGGVSIKDTAALHRSAMEKGLIGTDVSPIAAHLTSASLAAIGTGEPYGDTRIGWVKVGGPLSAIGSLDYFKKDEIRDLWDSVAGSSAGRESTELSVHIPDDSIDWILMNPPYSRTRGKQPAFDIAGLSEEERKACQKEWERAVRNEPVTRTAGMAASFLALARKKVKSGGRIGFVLPITAAFAKSWEKTRRMVEREFTGIIAIAVVQGEALGKNALSADTGMGEMILVATRRRELGECSPIKCVTLYGPVTRPGEAGEMARAIFHAAGKVRGSGSNCPIRVGDTEVGLVNVYDAGGEGAPWGPLGATHADLAIAADKIVGGRIEFLDKSMELAMGMTIVKELLDVGPTHHLIGNLEGNKVTGAFELSKITGPGDAVGEDRSLWKADAGTQCRLVVLPTHKGRPVKDEEARKMRAERSKLFYARGMQWTSQSSLAAMTKHKAMGGRAWLGLNHDDLRICKAFALWANSTLGMMVHWTQGQRTQVGRSSTQVRAIQHMPCPKLDEIDDTMRDLVAAEFDRLAFRRLLPACQAHADEARWEIDAAVVKMLGLPEDADEVIAEMRLLWCREPSVRGKDLEALALLAKRDAEQY